MQFDKNVRGDYSIAVYDLRGTKLMTKNITVEKYSDEVHLLDLEAFEKGLYIMNISNGFESLNVKVITE